MPLNKDLLRDKFAQWGQALSAYRLPGWETFPALPLYMDQIIYLLNQYLTLGPMEGQERLVTPAMINNYVKLKIIPPPVKKRYGRTHLAYLVMVCVLKRSLNTSDIRKALPLNLEEGEVRGLYEGFLQAFEETKERFQREAGRAAQTVLTQNGPSVTSLVFRAAAAANLSQLLAEQVLRLYPAPETEKME